MDLDNKGNKKLIRLMLFIKKKNNAIWLEEKK